MVKALALICTALAAVSASAQALRADEMCLECFSIRVGPAHTVRGPFADELDAPLSALRLANGNIRAFSANGATYAIEGQELTELSGTRTQVMAAGQAGSLEECGRWLTSIVQTDDRLIGMVHQEAICNYGPNGQTHKSMAIATSTDQGLSWTHLGTVVTGRDAPRAGTTTGEGDCTMINGGDGYLYAYCQRNYDWQNYVARAPLSDPSQWRKYADGAWSELGLEGNAEAIGFYGVGASVLKDFDAIALLATDPWAGGIRLSVSLDKVHFQSLAEPLAVIDGSEWNRPAPSALLGYPVLLDQDTGANEIDGLAALTYVYVPPHLGFESRYLVVSSVSITPTATPQSPQVGAALARWVNTATSASITTTGPIAGAGPDYRLDGVLAYALTAAPTTSESVKLLDCLTPDNRHALAVSDECDALGASQYRTAGWLFASPLPNTTPIYRCTSTDNHHWFAATDAICEGRGLPDRLLGYGLAS